MAKIKIFRIGYYWNLKNTKRIIVHPIFAQNLCFAVIIKI
ncbi:hypothetical protein LEP1GSC034_3103 [Leptospira interrogans str. 2003000735]|uniref:Uncharacterized protein n=13 Tax=Leptospira interrogans TaxID=173 RepID=A0A0E2D7S9_LEPIR|nr:hypothetical protein G436_1464 [Leptospira interrogans serovar Hardjo str. Norma]EJP05552.1 hypothetical protein LEP1GSC007_1269 [Leptospira interrogans serovar Bulgarica str. Mallika]EJP17089.1 hypothetical protein LEP1GSC080_2393 [Leptospira interrogans str. FPW2026]EKN86215.1 hypothetical protein LEP1GSC027_2689 [Leptospira interrogans str. 2002000624]EKO05616.1 hypothetical protein LEP1GSC077_3320 [Leptospira interrogans str. C10069]EKO25969.1 hypothetical protein LEP1GSC104_1651 [Lepto